jgi:hypothetical protein
VAAELKLERIIVAPVGLSVPEEAVVSTDDLEWDITAKYVLANDWWMRDEEAPDVRIVGYIIGAKGGQGFCDVSWSFFNAGQRAAWEQQIADEMEADANARDEELRFGGDL